LGDPGSYYSRQLKLPGWGPEGQAQLARSKVLVVGVGGLGCPALEALARAGVGTLVFCDSDKVEASNLARQTLFSAYDTGKLKVEAAAAALARSNPHVTLEPRAVRVDESNVRALVEAADLVVDGSDSFTTKFLIHDACRSAGKPLVAASAHQWDAQVRAFDFAGGPGCWRCLYSEVPEDGCVGTCADEGVAGALTAMVGSFQALTALRMLLKLETETLAEWVIDAADWTPRVLRWKPDPACDCSRGPGDWSWLRRKSVNKDLWWKDIGKEERQVVIDVREPFEIQPGEWEFFEKSGSQVEHFPFTRWAFTQPEWDTGRTYLIVCAHGIRSANALKTVPQGVRALSLAGGVAGLELR